MWAGRAARTMSFRSSGGRSFVLRAAGAVASSSREGKHDRCRTTPKSTQRAAINTSGIALPSCYRRGLLPDAFDFAITADTIEEDRVNIHERWESDAQLLCSFEGLVRTAGRPTRSARPSAEIPHLEHRGSLSLRAVAALLTR